MTQAYNLSQLANKVNTSGQLDATTGLLGATPVANGGTGSSTLTANNVILGNGTSAVQTVAPGTTGNVLTSTGTTWQSAAPIPAFTGPNAKLFSTSGSWTVPTGITSAQVTVVAAGGNGGSTSGFYSVAGGGGGGGAAIGWVTSLTPGSSISITVGVSSGTKTSSFGSYISASGGSNGSNSGQYAASAGGAGGSVSSALTDILTATGSSGATAFYFTGPCSTDTYSGGGGSASPLVLPGPGGAASATGAGYGIFGVVRSNGGAGRYNTSANGVAATNYGGGGSGGNSWNTNITRTGGAGSNGFVLVQW